MGSGYRFGHIPERTGSWPSARRRRGSSGWSGLQAACFALLTGKWPDLRGTEYDVPAIGRMVRLSERGAYGPLWGFLFGWAGMLVMLTWKPGCRGRWLRGIPQLILSLRYPPRGFCFLSALPFGVFRISAAQVVAALSIAVLGMVNYRGVRAGNAVQSGLTLIKIAGIAAIPILAIIYHPARA